MRSVSRDILIKESVFENMPGIERQALSSKGVFTQISGGSVCQHTF